MSHETPPVFVKQHGAVRMVHALQTRSILPVQASRAVSHVVWRRRDPITRVCGATFKNHLLDGLDDADDTRVAFAGLSVSRLGKGLKKIHAGFGRGHNSAAYHPPCARSFSRRSWRETLCTRSPVEVPVGSSRGPHEGAPIGSRPSAFPPSLACTRAFPSSRSPKPAILREGTQERPARHSEPELERPIPTAQF